MCENPTKFYIRNFMFLYFMGDNKLYHEIFFLSFFLIDIC